MKVSLKISISWIICDELTKKLCYNHQFLGRLLILRKHADKFDIVNVSSNQFYYIQLFKSFDVENP